MMNRGILSRVKKAGIPIIWVEWGYDAIEVIQNEEPEYKVATPDGILEIIL
ncbi:hypothetical protein OL548_15765 [Lysinibacillus sp. MHQ-1]|nr:hypothetical protein OL548_15765 [Lysinibacillus sp. MHQ-1]